MGKTAKVTRVGFPTHKKNVRSRVVVDKKRKVKPQRKIVTKKKVKHTTVIKHS